MKRQPWWCLLGLAACLAVADTASAQSSRTSTTSSSTGSSISQTGSNSSTSSTGNTGASVRNSAGLQGLQELSNMSAAQVSNDVFSGSRADPLAGDQAAGRRSTTQSFGSSFGGSLFGGGRGGSSTAGRQNRDNSRRAQYSTRVEFAAPRGAAATSAQAGSAARGISQSLATLPGLKVQVRIEGSTAVLNGTAESASDRRVAERMALLEPGVRSVQNDITVQATNSSGG